MRAGKRKNEGEEENRREEERGEQGRREGEGRGEKEECSQNISPAGHKFLFQKTQMQNSCLFSFFFLVEGKKLDFHLHFRKIKMTIRFYICPPCSVYFHASRLRNFRGARRLSREKWKLYLLKNKNNSLLKGNSINAIFVLHQSSKLNCFYFFFFSNGIKHIRFMFIKKFLSLPEKKETYIYHF